MACMLCLLQLSHRLQLFLATGCLQTTRLSFGKTMALVWRDETVTLTAFSSQPLTVLQWH